MDTRFDVPKLCEMKYTVKCRFLKAFLMYMENTLYHGMLPRIWENMDTIQESILYLTMTIQKKTHTLSLLEWFRIRGVII